MAETRAKRKRANAADCETLPDYIIQRNAQATSAGLRVVSRRLGALLTTAYQGTEAAWRASGFIYQNVKFATIAADRRVSFRMFTADKSIHSVFSLTRMSGDEYRIEIPDELMPESVTDAGDGIMAYEMRWPLGATGDDAQEGGYLLYIGPRDALFARGFAPLEAAEKHNDFYDRYSEDAVKMWECCRGGIRIYIDAPERVAQLEREKKEKDRRDYKDPGDMLDQLSERVWVWLWTEVLRFKETRTTSGHIYTIQRDSLDDIRYAFTELRETIMGAQVDVRRESKATPPAAVAAKSDAAFQAALSDLVAGAPKLNRRRRVDDSPTT